MSNRLEVATIGELLGVVAPYGSDSPWESTTVLERSIGGAEVNVAVTLAQLGHRVAWAGVVGDDPFGRDGVHLLRGVGVDVSRVVVEPLAPTGLYLKERLPFGATRYHSYRAFSAAARASYLDVDVDFLTSGRVLHLTGITALISDAGHQLLRRLMNAALAADVHVSFDVNLREQLLRGRDAAAVLRPLCDLADTVFVSASEADRILAATSRDIPTAMRSMRATTVVVHDARRITAYTAGGATSVHARVLEVVDPTGAGDAFAAGYLSGWLAGRPFRERLERAEDCAAHAVVSRVDQPVGLRRPTSAVAAVER